MDLQIRNRVALVTAASKGFGKECALRLAREGADVAICARNMEALEETAAFIRAETGVRVLPLVCDLIKPGDVERMVAQVREHFDSIDILITNVPHPKMGSFVTLSDEDWQYGFESSLMPVIRLCREVLPHMREKQWGRIVHIASFAVKEPSLTYLLSGVFRTGVTALSKSLSKEFGREGILVNTLAPGLFRTPLGEEILAAKAQRQGVSLEQAEAELAAPTSVGRIGEVEELSGLVAFLCSEAASHITGQVIAVDGGKSHGLL